MPVMDARAAQGVDTELEPGVLYRVQIEHLSQVLDILRYEIVAMRGGRAPGLIEQHSPHAVQAAFQEFVGFFLDERRDPALRGTAMRRIVLEAAVFRRVVRRR